MLKKNKKQNKAFTLIEALIAIAILMISIAAPLSLANKGIQAASLSKQQITAYYLAQDAYEWIKNKTEYNKVVGTSAEKLVDNLNNCVNDNNINNKCIIDTTNPPTQSPDAYTDQKLTINGQGVYGYNGNKTIFKRYVEISKYHNANTGYLDEIIVKVTVEWKVPYSPLQKYVLTSHITNW